MRFREFHFQSLNVRRLPWYWSLTLGLAAVILIGVLSIAALVGAIIVGTGYALYRLSGFITGLFRNLGDNADDRQLMPRERRDRQDWQQPQSPPKHASDLDVIDVEAERLDDK